MIYKIQYLFAIWLIYIYGLEIRFLQWGVRRMLRIVP